ncbi:MAG: hypothetical protein GY745_00875 [Actinomycetia bacterium]|nr:hypothetical protein [Actinomycetes bacterium]MCP4083600.1 hypothetical protein [Actinomycetes bacterium]
MAMAEEETEPEPPRGHVTVVYLGPVAPHWEIRSDFGDAKMVDEFRARVMARLLLLPPHDPQFRRNRERVNRDAERELLLIDWDLGMPEEDQAPEAAEAPTEAGAEGAAPAEA